MVVVALQKLLILLLKPPLSNQPLGISIGEDIYA